MIDTSLEKIAALILAAIVLFLCFMVSQDLTKSDWCNDKGGTYVSGHCIDNNSIIELDKE